MTQAFLIGSLVGLFLWSIFVAWRLALAESHIKRLKATLDDHGIYE